MKLISRKLLKAATPFLLQEYEKAHGRYDKSRHRNILAQFMSGHPLVQKRKMEDARIMQEILKRNAK